MRGRVQNLPAVTSFGEIISLHPGLNPTVKVPKSMRREVDHSLHKMNFHQIVLFKISVCVRPYHLLSFVSAGSSLSFSIMSIERFPSTSWAESKLVMTRDGIPRQRITVKIHIRSFLCSYISAFTCVLSLFKNNLPPHIGFSLLILRLSNFQQESNATKNAELFL